jgi:CRISPR type III-A-associated RAMP protein Csm4
MPEIVEGELPQLLLNSAEDSGAYWLLSMFHPAGSDAIDWQHGNYSLSTRGGRVEIHGDEKKPTRMLTEGSVIVSASAPIGAASDVAPENFAHPVYRSGFALAIPIPLAPAARLA